MKLAKLITLIISSLVILNDLYTINKLLQYQRTLIQEGKWDGTQFTPEIQTNIGIIVLIVVCWVVFLIVSRQNGHN